MVQIDTLALTVLALNGFIYFLVTQLEGVSKIRGGAISGWISSFIGFYVLIKKNKLPLFGFEATTLIFIYAIIALFGVLIVFVGRDRPSNYNIPLLGDLLYYYPRVGIFMGVIIAALSQILA